MGYKVSTNDPLVSFDQEKTERRIATYCKNQVPPITSEAEWDAAVDAMTATQLQAALRVLLKAYIKIGGGPTG